MKNLNKNKFKACILVDNPLRDLEGMVLIAYHLSKLNFQCFLTPMYFQAFDILSIKPDIVVINYLRKNNVNLIKRFVSEKIKIVVLDTEGSPGFDINEFSSSC